MWGRAHGASEALPFHGICEEQQGGTCVIQADGRTTHRGHQGGEAVSQGGELRVIAQGAEYIIRRFSRFFCLSYEP